MSVYKRDKTGKKVKDKEPGTWNYDFMYDGVRYRKALPKIKTKTEAEAAENAKYIEVTTDVTARLQDLTDQVRILKSELEVRNRAEIEAKKNRNKAGDQEIEFEEFVNTVYLPEKQTYNPETYFQFAHIAKIFCAHFKGKMMHEIATADVRAFRRTRAEGLTNRGRPRALASLNRERNQLSGIFELAVDNEVIIANPVHKVKPYPVDNAREKVLEPEEEAKLFDALTGDRAKLKPVALLVLNTGLRLREAVELKWDQVDLSDNEDGRKITIKGKAKGQKKKKRAIPLNDVALDLLKELRAKCDGKGFVFSERGMSHIRVCHAFSKICDEIGLPDVTMHTLRHTFATRLARRGDVNMEQVRKLMGHSDMRMTQRYSHLNDESLRETVKKLEKPTLDDARSCEPN